ncbi:MAG: BrnT family toxin [Chloroflexi bacterium]|nr:BrnT family toxin [Chloroflexota bacterium]
MVIRELIWLDDVVDKLDAKHNVVPEEVSQVIQSHPHIRFISKGRRQRDENVYAAYGRTEEGRYLTVFFIYKPDKRALIISARDMDAKERKRYAKKGP